MGVADRQLGALVFILFVPTKYAIELQLLGGIWIIQTLPTVMLGVYTRWFNSWRCSSVGPSAPMPAPRWPSPRSSSPPTRSPSALHLPGYTAFYTLILNLWWRSC